jgi:cytochrome c
VDLIAAIKKNSKKLVKTLLEQGCDPNYYEDSAQVTPLHFAAQVNALEVISLLVTAGANLESKTQDGYTPLDIAKMHGNSEVVQLLQNLLLKSK